MRPWLRRQRRYQPRTRQRPVSLTDLLQSPIFQATMAWASVLRLTRLATLTEKKREAGEQLHSLALQLWSDSLLAFG